MDCEMCLTIGVFLRVIAMSVDLEEAFAIFVALPGLDWLIRKSSTLFVNAPQ